MRLFSWLLEVLLSALIFILFIPVLIAFAIYIKIYDGGPVFFMQEREGHNGKTFRAVKLRTMKLNVAEVFEKEIKTNPELLRQVQVYNKIVTQMDPRVAGRFSNFLRRSSLDETSQIINVIKGEMNVIGPRPLPLYDAEKVRPDRMAKRSTIKPGLTGLWQISGRNTTTFDNMIRYDLFYVDHKSFPLDLVIAAKTAFVFFETDKTG
ncbi:sugar transferase [Erwinia sp. Leaf53]|uniref:sugar transferase n=1 Tax=Erwinia sp. Leaf53 TaxID=1736225 RepID=UPI000B0C45A4|nr:sugar transferase [Erwinia sp. Leaf53]